MTFFVDDLRELIASNRNLPSLPEVVLELHAILDDEMAGEAQVARVIERDPALASRMLKVANSAFFTRDAHGVRSVMAAVTRLGLRQVHAMSLAVSVVRAFSGRGMDHRRFWRHSLGVAMAADALARRTGGTDPKDAYVAGLLHDVGLLVLDQFFAERFERVVGIVRTSGTPLWRVEEDLLGLDHGEIGGLLLSRWSLPQDIAEAVANHHHPAGAPASAVRLSRVLQAAEGLAGESDFDNPDEGPPEVGAGGTPSELDASAVHDVRERLAELGETAETLASLL